MFDLKKIKNQAEKFASETKTQFKNIEDELSATKQELANLQNNQQETTKSLKCMMDYIICTKTASYSDSNQLEQIKVCGEILEFECQF